MGADERLNNTLVNFPVGWHGGAAGASALRADLIMFVVLLSKDPIPPWAALK